MEDETKKELKNFCSGAIKNFEAAYNRNSRTPSKPLDFGFLVHAQLWGDIYLRTKNPKEPVELQGGCIHWKSSIEKKFSESIFYFLRGVLFGEFP